MELNIEEFALIKVKLNYVHDKCTFGIIDISANLMFSIPIKSNRYMLTYEDFGQVMSKKALKQIVLTAKSNPFTISINQVISESGHLIIGFVEAIENSPMYLAQRLGIMDYKESTINGVDVISFVSTKEIYREFILYLNSNGIVSNISIKLEKNYLRQHKYQLSKMQEKAIEAAFFGGFYDNPKTTHLKDLSMQLGISIPTVNEYIRTAEQKILSSYFQHLN